MDSLASKINRLDHLLQKIKPDLVILSEHGLKEDQLLNTRLPGYLLAGGFSRKNFKKGEVAIYTNEDLGNSTQNVQTDIYILGLYQPPGGNVDYALDALSDTLDLLPIWKHPIIIIGDINIDRLPQVSNNSKQEKIEDYSREEETYLSRVENFQQKISDMDRQLGKEKQLLIDTQQIFEDHDRRQAQVLNDYEQKIKELSKEILI
ncbi:hypothetical protein J6590_097076 [Homalodisca vitripennis]|nr:hypothetical protein J6590_097076 [Homalodisca vitripennis]